MTINLVTLRKRIFTAFLFLIVEIGVLIWPVGLLREEAVDFLSGEGSYALDGDYEEGALHSLFPLYLPPAFCVTVCTTFSPCLFSESAFMI